MSDRWQLMDGSTQLVKDVRTLNLPREITEHALRLIDQSELPVVICPNAKSSINTGRPHQDNPYQFWITIKSGTTEREAERLLLSLLYYNIQHRMRCLLPMPTEAYLKRLHGNPKRTELLMDLVNAISSFSLSLASEFYLRNIATDQKIKQIKTDNNKKSLLEYIELQRKSPSPCLFRWRRENEASNLIHYAWCARYSPDNARWFIETLSKTLPRRRAKYYCGVVSAILGISETACLSYDGSNGEDIKNDIERQLIEILKLDDMLMLDTMNAYRSEPSYDGKYKHIYTFVPVGIDNEALALKGVRAANECLGLMREMNLMSEETILPKISFSTDSDVNMCAYNDREGNPYILIFLNFLVELERAVQDHQFSNACALIVNNQGIEYVRERLFRYTIFYATLHEYGHILHGDLIAMSANPEKQHQEDRADAFADRLFCKVLLFQYRPKNPTLVFAHFNEDKILAQEVKVLIQRFRCRHGRETMQ